MYIVFVNMRVPITLERPALLGRIIARARLVNLETHSVVSKSWFGCFTILPTVLDKLNEASIDTYAIGKINDIFNELVANHDAGTQIKRHGPLLIWLKAWLLEDFKHGFFTELVNFDALMDLPSWSHMDTVITCTNLTNVCYKKSLLLCVKMNTLSDYCRPRRWSNLCRVWYS